MESPRWGLDAQVHTSSDGWLRKKPGLSRELFVDTIHDVGNRYMGGQQEMDIGTLLGTNICSTKALLKMIFLFPRWDMLFPCRVNGC